MQPCSRTRSSSIIGPRKYLKIGFVPTERPSKIKKVKYIFFFKMTEIIPAIITFCKQYLISIGSSIIPKITGRKLCLLFTHNEIPSTFVRKVKVWLVIFFSLLKLWYISPSVISFKISSFVTTLRKNACSTCFFKILFFDFLLTYENMFINLKQSNFNCF